MRRTDIKPIILRRANGADRGSYKPDRLTSFFAARMSEAFLSGMQSTSLDDHTKTTGVRTDQQARPMTENSRVRILAVEDNPDTQTLLRYLLRPRFDVCLVSHVQDAIDAADGGVFDVFVLDINLGEQRTGIDLLHRLRTIPAYKDTPALALTAYAMPGDRDRFLKEGFNAYVSKPFTRNELFEAIQILVLSASQRH